MAYNLSIIYNLSMETGVYPHMLKRAKVIPIHKGDSRMETKNYRPISLLPIFNKIFEKILHSRITSFIEKYKILFNRQYGFQKGKSTEFALIDIHEKILEILNKKEIPCCVFLKLKFIIQISTKYTGLPKIGRRESTFPQLKTIQKE